MIVFVQFFNKVDDGFWLRHTQAIPYQRGGTLKKCFVLAFPPKNAHLTGRPNAKKIVFFFGAGGKK